MRVCQSIADLSPIHQSISAHRFPEQLEHIHTCLLLGSSADNAGLAIRKISYCYPLVFFTNVAISSTFMDEPHRGLGYLYADRYQVERVAGTGGMGTVYRAHDQHDGRVVALKLVHATSREDMERFAREAQLLSELRHPGIVSHVAHGQTPDGQCFLAMEWLDGHDLGRHLQNGPLSVHDSFQVLEQVTHALSVAHERGVVHRDLKPSNLFLVNGNVHQIKLLDFGIARRVFPSMAMTQAGVVIGTPQYMSPEQARGSRDITPAADIFSLGCVLYECLTGQPPFFAAHIAALLGRILFDDPVPVEERRPGISAHLSKLVHRLLHKDPTQRVPDAMALRAALANLGPLLEPNPALGATLVAPISREEGFAEQEQRLVSIVIANFPQEDLGTNASPTSPTVLAESHQNALLESLHQLGTTPDFLADGSLIVTVASHGSARDQVMRAARTALLVKARWPFANIAMATGRGVLQGRSAMGEVVDRAARALAIADSPSTERGIQIDMLSAKLLAGRFTMTSHSEGALLHCETNSIDAYRPLLGKPTSCVGRERELNSLESELDACIDERQAALTLITADAGVGKSRIRHEFVQRVKRRSEPVTVLLGRGDLLHVGKAYGLITSAIAAFANIADADNQNEQRRRLQESIGRLLPDAVKGRVIPLLGEMCGIPFSEVEYPILREIRQHSSDLPAQLQWAALTWLRAECHAAPVLFILDDLHWGDSLSIGFIDEALRALRDAPLFVVALARPDVHQQFPSLWKKHRPHTIALQGLGKRASARLVEEALGNQVDTETLDWIIQQSNGNALFLEELIRAAAEGLPKERPETVIAMLQARIGNLSARPRHALHAASIFGPYFWNTGIAHVLDLEDRNADVDAWLEELIEAELIVAQRTSRFVDQKEFAFRHALVYDAAYTLLSDHDRKLGHRRVAEYFERMPDPPRALLGRHYNEAGLFDKALAAFESAGDAAAKGFLFEEATLHYQHAEEALLRLDDTFPEWQRRRADLIVKQVQASLTVAPPPVTWQRIAKVRELLDVTDNAGEQQAADLLRRARVDYEAGKLHTYFDQYDAAAECFERVIRIADETHERTLSVLARGMHGRALFLEGRVLRSVQLLEQALIDQCHLDMNIDSARACSYLSIALAQCGRGRDAERHMAHIRNWIDAHDNLSYPSRIHINLGVANLLVHDFEAALRSYDICIEVGIADNEPVVAYLALDMSAFVHSFLHDTNTALQQRQKALELRAKHGSDMQKELLDGVHAKLLLKSGDANAARDLAARTAKAARERGSLWALMLAERVWGLALAVTGAAATEVDAHLFASLSLAVEVGFVMEALQTEIALAELYIQRNDYSTARTYLESARTRLTEDMLPCTIAYYQPIIERELRRCEAYE